MAEYYRQCAFVSSVLAGFALTFYATLLSIDRAKRAVSWAALLSVMASIYLLVVTLGTTFAAARLSAVGDGARVPPVLQAQQAPLSMFCIAGIVLLLASFALGGWIRSRRLGIATTAAALFGTVAVSWLSRHSSRRCDNRIAGALKALLAQNLSAKHLASVSLR